MRQVCYYKMRQKLGFSLENATVLLQNATIITNCDNFITNCDSTMLYCRKSEIPYI